jgi:hypothetical protein
MGALALLETAAIAVTPGSEAAVTVRVRNTGTVVDQFTIDVLGDAEGWALAEPPSLSLFPGAEETTRVVFRPPRSPEVPAGPLPFGVRVQSREDPAGSVVEEGTLHVEPFSDTVAELAPRTSRGSRGATHDLAIDNRGNTRLNATLSAIDPDRLLEFDLRPPSIVSDAGTAAFARIGVKPRKTFWRGTPQTRNFRVQLEPADGPPVAIDGTLLQEAILPPWFMRALLALLGLLLLLVLAWLFLLRPAIESSARQQAEDILAAVGITPPPGGFDGDGDGNGNGNGNGNGGASPSPNGGGTGGSPSPQPSVPLLNGNAAPTDGRLLPGGAPVTPDAGRTLFLTDLVFSNPSDTATGEIRLERSGQPLLVLRLENFRDLDFHFVTPIVVAQGQQLSLACPTGCTDSAVYYSGYQR